MTTLLLIRHAAHDLLGRALAGRAPGVHVNHRGRIEADLLATRLGHLPLTAIYTSPLERAQETVWPLAKQQMRCIRLHRGIDEIDFGNWTGKTFTELDPDPEWQKWNAERDRARCPGGESMREVQERVIRTLETLSLEHRDGHIAIVSHGDVIKAALMHYLRIPLNHILGFEISPASVSIITLNHNNAQVSLVNHTGELTP